MTVKLFKNSKVDGITRIGKWADKASQFAYFDGLDGSKTYNVNTVKLGEPLRINDKLNNLLGYGYGYIDYGDGFRYFFSVADLEMVTETITDVSYTMDCYDTAITQTDVVLQRATITRYPNAIGKSVIPIEPNYTHYTYLQKFKGNALLFVYTDNSGNYWTAYIDSTTGFNNYQMFSGEWLTSVSNYVIASNIICIGILPFKIPRSWLDTNGFSNPSESTTKFHLRRLGWSIDYLIPAFDNVSANITLKNDGKTRHEIRDMRNNAVFICPYGRTLSYSSGNFEISSTQICIRYRYLYDPDASIEYEDVIVPLEIPVIPDNKWLEYNYRLREIDIETRNLQLNQQLAGGLADTGSSVLMGMLSGGIAGIGAGLGAGLGAGSGLISTLGNYAINSYYNPEYQRLVDKTYINANNGLNNYGTITKFIFDNYIGGLYLVEWDDDAKTTYDNDIASNGYYVNYSTDEFWNDIIKGPITADVEILGDIPVAWKEQIHDRLMRGVVFE